MLSTGHLAHCRKLLTIILMKASATAVIFVLLGQGAPRLRTVGCGPLQNIAVLKLSGYEIMHYNRELSC